MIAREAAAKAPEPLGALQQQKERQQAATLAVIVAKRST